jgi:hypothetical protein
MDKNEFSRREFLKRGVALTGASLALSKGVSASGATANSIVLENRLTGAPQTQWDLSGKGQYSGFGQNTTGVTHYIEGYADNISVNRGQTINFKVNTDCKNYRIDIYRLGYYQSFGARKITTIPMSSAAVQPTPLTNAALGLVDAGNWSITTSWAVPSTSVSGVYIAHLVRQDAVTGENHIPFIVRDDGTKHDIVFQTSDLTWQAYNGWGGPSLYGGASNSDGRAYKVSYNRPIGTRDNVGTYAGPQDFLFGVEISAIRWLEAAGYDVCYIAGVDTDRFGSELLNHKVFLSVGHDEYWSGNQRANVEAARGTGVHLAFMSGNEILWKTRWEPSTDSSAAAYRTLVCYKETRDSAKIDPSPQWTGSWRDPRFSPPADGGRPENALTGQFWTVDSWRADTITIPYPMTQLRFWRNTTVAKTKSGQASLVPNYLGYEWDESPDNGFRPAGLIHLSSTTLPVNTYMIDYGLTDGAYVATHNLSLYRYSSSGSLVFGAGTVYWAWGLDADHDLQAGAETPVDLNVQQATVNLLADMGLVPQTLQSGLVPATQSTDTVAPVSMINPPGSVIQQQIIVLTGTASDTGGQVAGVEVSTDGGSSWHPAQGTTSWTYNWWPRMTGTVNISSRAVDDSLNLEVPGPGISVSVTPGVTLSLFNGSALSPYGGSNAPALVGPVRDTGAVELGLQFQVTAAGSVTGIRFYKNPWNSGVHVGNLWSASGALLGSASFTSETAYGWQQVSLPAPVPITVGTTYVVSYHSVAGDYSTDPNYFATQRSSGSIKAPADGGTSVYAYGSSSLFPANSGGANNYWVDLIFSRASVTGSQSPTANNDSGFVAALNTPFSIASSALLANDSDPNGFPLTVTGVSNPMNGTVSYSASTKTVTFVPTSGYPSPNPTGSASFNYSISNGNGGTAIGLVTLTVSVPTTSLYSATSVPATVTVNDPNSIELGVKFQSASSGQVTAIRFYKGPQNLGSHVGNLWSSAGALLSTVTFANETASGWQQAALSSPVSIAQGLSYVVSYHTKGFYSADGNYFANALTSGSLTAPSSASGGGNGVYVYGSSSVFPTNTYNASNYWVDVAFANTSLGNQPPTANDDSGFITQINTMLSLPASALLSNDTDPNGFSLSITGVGSPTNGTVSYNSGSTTVTFVPTTGYTGSAGFTYSISNGNGGTASANVSLIVGAPILNLFSSSSTPGGVTINDSNSVELGVKFQASTAGKIVGIRFYKGPQNTGSHTGNLWSSTGLLLNTAAFAQETASGWQQVYFLTPVAVTAGTTYVASYHTSGFYSADANYFASLFVNGQLMAPASSASGGNGVYAYGSSSSFPSGTYNATNYWVDVMFSQGS